MLDQQSFFQANSLSQEYVVIDVSLDVTAGVAGNASLFNKANKRSHRTKSNCQDGVYIQVRGPVWLQDRLAYPNKHLDM
jgi:hypothetical protein